MPPPVRYGNISLFIIYYSRLQDRMYVLRPQLDPELFKYIRWRIPKIRDKKYWNCVWARCDRRVATDRRARRARGGCDISARARRGHIDDGRATPEPTLAREADVRDLRCYRGAGGAQAEEVRWLLRLALRARGHTGEADTEKTAVGVTYYC